MSDPRRARTLRRRLLGRASALAVAAALATGLVGAAGRAAAQTIDLASGADIVLQGAAAGDFSGSSVSGAGDVNGDGVDDVIIGAPGADPQGRENAGASYVVFGQAQALDPAAALAALIEQVEAPGLRPRGIENSLVKKLENAQRDVAKGKASTARGKLQVFVNEVTAQRGKRIAASDADALIAAATAVLDALAA